MIAWNSSWSALFLLLERSLAQNGQGNISAHVVIGLNALVSRTAKYVYTFVLMANWIQTMNALRGSFFDDCFIFYAWKFVLIYST